MKTLWKLTKEAARYEGLYVIAILSTFGLTIVNLYLLRVLCGTHAQLMEKKGIYYNMQKAQLYDPTCS